MNGKGLILFFKVLVLLLTIRFDMVGPVLGTLLTQCGLPVNGTVAAKQSRFKQWIGVATAV